MWTFVKQRSFPSSFISMSSVPHSCSSNHHFDHYEHLRGNCNEYQRRRYQGHYQYYLEQLSNLHQQLPSEAVRLLAAAGSSLSLICFLFFIKVLLFNLLATSPSATGAVQQQQQGAAYSYAFLPIPHSNSERQELRASLDILQSSEPCSRLLRCLNYGLELRVTGYDTDSEGYEGCKSAYLRCKSEGHLHHLNRVLEAVDS